MAERLREEFDLEPTLILGHSGIFEVAVHGRVVSKKALNGFPVTEESVQAVARALEVDGRGTA